DVFRSQMDSAGNWQEPVNLGYPINDHHEQSALTVSMNGRQAFFSSRRDDALGGLDIYAFELPPEMRPHPVAYLAGTIVDADDRSNLQVMVACLESETIGAVFAEQFD